MVRLKAKPLLMARGDCPVWRDSIPHDLRLLLNRDQTKNATTSLQLCKGFGFLPLWLLPSVTSIPILTSSPCLLKAYLLNVTLHSHRMSHTSLLMGLSYTSSLRCSYSCKKTF